eukprot:757370-Hanusia_phi.AAC.2
MPSSSAITHHRPRTARCFDLQRRGQQDSSHRPKHLRLITAPSSSTHMVLPPTRSSARPRSLRTQRP